MRQMKVTVVGAGLAGSEAAWQLAKRGVNVDLYEMRPTKMTEAHSTAQCAELVCSNSFGSTSAHSASSILKNELEMMGAFVLSAAREFSVPAGASLAVDREKFSGHITRILEAHPRITVHRSEVVRLPEDELTIVATGPLTTPALARELTQWVGDRSLYFYDAISPIVSADSLDLNEMYFKSRYDKGDADFLNIPLTREQYEEFYHDLMTGEVTLPHDFEEEKYFESCMPIEAIAARGPRTLAFGPMKPVGLNDPRTGQRAHAVIQLRTENKEKTAYNLVGFQTKLKYGEQVRIFRKLPGLANAEFLRLGSMHRNTFIDSPRALLPSLQLRANQNIFVAGQLTGTEGYLESSATGLLAGLNAYRILRGEVTAAPPRPTMLGSLVHYVTDPERENFQPINSNFGILPPLEVPILKDKKKRNAAYEERSRDVMAAWAATYVGAPENSYSKPVVPETRTYSLPSL